MSQECVTVGLHDGPEVVNDLLWHQQSFSAQWNEGVVAQKLSAQKPSTAAVRPEKYTRPAEYGQVYLPGAGFGSRRKDGDGSKPD